MSNKMLIDATHPEETRVVVVKGSRVEEFDFESANRKQLRGNIYLAKVTRVEPSLQAAFVEYGGNRHGFLAFSEIHPDYYQIPVADRMALLAAEEREARDEERAASGNGRRSRDNRRGGRNTAAENAAPAVSGDAPQAEGDASRAGGEAHGDAHDAFGHSQDASPSDQSPSWTTASDDHDNGSARGEESDNDAPDDRGNLVEVVSSDDHGDDDHGDEESVESVGSEDALEELPERRRPRMKQYKIQEVIKRRQVMLIQVVKEERGNKGAAVTTYLSLAGRYSVLMPNTGRGGGISRKITSPADRKRLKEIAHELEVPEGMGVILRTAGASRTKAEIKRDFEYLLRLWENVRELTLRSSAPMLVYEEGSLVKRSIRDLYNKDISQVLVAGDEAYREAKDFMRMLMPSHAKNVQPYRDNAPIFARYSVEPQLDAMFSPQVTLRSGGYIVINQTEALVSIDVNSGRSTREHNIEDTAYQTNMEAAEEVARQLRLRDLAGLIVIDFIDMEESRNNKAVERKLKDCLKNDRARIQVGRISHFGLMEMSRQRIRTGVLEGSTELCPHCLGAGIVRSTESVALHVLRSLEDNLLKGATHHLTVRTRTAVALYILNQKRRHLGELEERFGLTITLSADEHISGQHFALERGELILNPRPVIPLVHPDSVMPEDEEEDEDEIVDDVQEAAPRDEERSADGESEGEGQNRGGKRRRRRRRRRGGEGSSASSSDAIGQSGGDEGDDGDDQDMTVETTDAALSGDGDDGEERDEGEAGDDEAGRKRSRRRGRRGGRRRSSAFEAGAEGEASEGEASEGDAVSDDGARDDEARHDEARHDDAVIAGPMEETAAEEFAPADEDHARSQAEDERGGAGTEAAEPEVAAAEDAAPVTDDAPAADEAPEAAEASGGAEAVPASEPAAEQAPEPAPAARAPQPEPDDDRPKRSGWWQRRSFF